MEAQQTNRLETAWIWYKLTAMLIGMPLLLVIMLVSLQKFAFTGTCYVAGWRCEYALLQDSASRYLAAVTSINATERSDDDVHLVEKKKH